MSGVEQSTLLIQEGELKTTTRFGIPPQAIQSSFSVSVFENNSTQPNINNLPVEFEEVPFPADIAIARISNSQTSK